MSRARFIASVTGKPMPDTTIPNLIAAVARETGVTRFQILSKNRRAAWVRARQEVMRRAYATGRFSLPQIGKVFHRDHTTILHGIRRATERLDQ